MYTSWCHLIITENKLFSGFYTCLPQYVYKNYNSIENFNLILIRQQNTKVDLFHTSVKWPKLYQYLIGLFFRFGVSRYLNSSAKKCGFFLFFVFENLTCTIFHKTCVNKLFISTVTHKNMSCEQNYDCILTHTQKKISHNESNQCNQKIMQ